LVRLCIHGLLEMCNGKENPEKEEEEDRFTKSCK